MAKAFFNGGKLLQLSKSSSADHPGLLFSTVVMLSIAGISLWSFLLLMQAYMVVPGSFGGELARPFPEASSSLYQIWEELYTENTCEPLS
jgi:hypothetical protein